MFFTPTSATAAEYASNRVQLDSLVSALMMLCQPKSTGSASCLAANQVCPVNHRHNKDNTLKGHQRAHTFTQTCSKTHVNTSAVHTHTHVLTDRRAFSLNCAASDHKFLSKAQAFSCLIFGASILSPSVNYLVRS